MVSRKSKTRIKSETLTMDIMRTDPAKFVELAESESLDRRFGIYPAADGRGVTFGSPLQSNEHLGEGLPELGDEREVFGQWNLKLDIRVSYDHEGTTYLEVAQPGGGTFHRFKFDGVDRWDAFKASGRFNNSFDIFLIYFGINHLFADLCCENANTEDRDDAYKLTMRAFGGFFKSILKPKRKREIEKREVRPGLTITTYQSIESGREPKTKAEIEQEKNKFILDIFEALRKIESYAGPKTILEAGNILYPTSNNPKKTLDNTLQNHHLSWKDLKRDYKNLNN